MERNRNAYISVMKQLTIIIAEHNEGAQLLDTLNSLYTTSDPDLYNVIVVSDGSKIEAPDTGRELRINLPKRRGVGASNGRLFACAITISG